MHMRFMIGLVAAAVAIVSVAGNHTSAQQQTPDARAVAKAGFTEVASWLAQSADLIPADKYTYKPVDTVRSTGEMIAHAVDGMRWFCGSALTDLEWSDATEKGRTDKATMVAALKTATASCATMYDNPKARLEKLFGNVAHLNLHYGNLVTYMRMLGLKPPSS